jgi:hypothetical protein
MVVSGLAVTSDESAVSACIFVAAVLLLILHAVA